MWVGLKEAEAENSEEVVVVNLKAVAVASLKAVEAEN